MANDIIPTPYSPLPPAGPGDLDPPAHCVEKNQTPVPAMRARTHRVERLADLIRQELTELIEYEVKDPRGGLASVPAVQLSEILRQDRVLVRVPGDDPQRETSLVGLEA